MAESSEREPSQEDVLSQYVLSASSMEDDGRLFVQDKTRRLSDTVCRYYLQGTCFFGPNCKFDHVVQNNQTDTESNSNDAHFIIPLRHSANHEVHNVTDRDGINKKIFQQPRFNTSNHNTSKNGSSDTNTPGRSWVNAPEFVPKCRKSYADIVKANTEMKEPEIPASEELCPLNIFGQCANAFDDGCQLLHGDVCELCHQACLHPYDEEQRKLHRGLCEKALEEEMEFSFAVQSSLDKTCSICMEVVMEKIPLSERRFGILDKCKHVFCLSCIRKWRRSKHHGSDQRVDNSLYPVVTRTCPVCRIVSDFITPSAYFVDTEEEKKKVIAEYKNVLSKKPCKYFKQGKGTCPFGGACFYLHAKADGTKVNLPVPTRRRRTNQDGELDYMGDIFLWEFLEYREENILISVHLTDIFSSPESDDNSSDSYLLDESF